MDLPTSPEGASEVAGTAGTLGEMVQLDGAHHDWFVGRRPAAVLMVLIDDATNTLARFFEGEASLETFRRYVQRYGLPHAVYAERTGSSLSVDNSFRSDAGERRRIGVCYSHSHCDG